MRSAHFHFSRRKPIKKVKESRGTPIHSDGRNYHKILFFVTLFTLINVFAFSLAFADEITYHSDSRRDPFVPLIGPDGQIKTAVRTDDVIIEGIITDRGGESIALINGELYKAGDSINESLVVEIFSDRVILAAQDEEKTIWLREEQAR